MSTAKDAPSFNYSSQQTVMSTRAMRIYLYANTQGTKTRLCLRPLGKRNRISSIVAYPEVLPIFINIPVNSNETLRSPFNVRPQYFQDELKLLGTVTARLCRCLCKKPATNFQDSHDEEVIAKCFKDWSL